MASQGFPLEQPLTIVPATKLEERKGEIDVRAEETLLPDVKPRDWLAKLKRRSSATAVQYGRLVHQFEEWLGVRHITQELIEEYIELINSQGKSSIQLVAALKYRYVTFGKLHLEFKGLAEQSKQKKPHKYLAAGQRDHIDQQLNGNTKMRLAC